MNDTESLLQPDAEVTAEPVAEEATVTAEAEPVETTDTEATPAPSTEKKDGVQKRIDELTKARRAEERARIAAEDRERYWREQAQKQPEPVKENTALKTLEDFNYDEAKHFTYLNEEARKGAVEAARHEIREDEARRVREQKQSAFASREDKFLSEAEDYYDSLRDPSNALSMTMLEVAREMENGPAVLYYLSKNQDVARNLYHLSPLVVAAELGKIEAKVTAKKGSAVSSAPDPAPKIKAANPASQKKPEDMNDAEFARYRRGVKERLRKG